MNSDTKQGAQMTSITTLNTLFEKFITLPTSLNHECKNLTLDTRTLNSGDVFFSLSPNEEENKNLILQAIEKGAAAVVVDTPGENKVETLTLHHKQYPKIAIHNLKKHLGELASRFYHHPQNSLDLIAITGTSGKTSCAHFITNALHPYFSCGMIGTLGYGLCGQLTPLDVTTPDLFTLYRLLRELKNQGAKVVVMEVSSHALMQERIQGLHFKIGIFTNLTQDHLDYHGTLENYAAAKRLLFDVYPMEYALFNQDDPYGQNWLDTITHPKQKYIYTLNQKTTSSLYPTISAQHITTNIQGIKTSIKTPWGNGVLHSSLLGQVNLYNLLVTLTTLGIYQIPLPDILKQLSELHSVPGRMEKIGGKDQPLIIIDYSHKPDALQKALEILKHYCEGELWCVFGCGGNRDKSKRSIMGSIVEHYADNAIITDDNPRHEDPKEIAQHILDGFKNKDDVIIEHDRRRAIYHAVSCAQSDDVILIAGKGHENYQIIGDQKNPFNDNIEAKLALENRIERL